MSYKDLSKQKFGKLTVIRRISDKVKPSGQHVLMYECLCECGNIVNVRAEYLKTSHTKSCGCLRKEKSSHTTHGKTGTRIHDTWRSMKRRCYTKSHKEYERYGGRGITVCDEWKDKFECFYEWAMQNGYNDNLTIDRINVNGNYEPSNCRWITIKEQQNNRRNNHYITYNGETLTAIQFAKKYNMNNSTLITRLNRGWSIEKIMDKHNKLNTQ